MTPSTKKSGFTLIEILIVIVIIVVLTGLVFRLSKAATDKSTIARETARIQVMHSAIEEFRAEYGIYPPVEADDDGVQPIAYCVPFPETLAQAQQDDIVDNFEFGLVSFFLNRIEGASLYWSYFDNKLDKGAHASTQKEYWQKKGKNTYYETDKDGTKRPAVSSRDLAFIKRVKPLMVKFCNNDNFTHIAETFSDEDTHSRYIPNGNTPGKDSRTDSWGNNYVYIAPPPYTSYAFFSRGPDGKYDKDDPTDRSKPANQDNIYGDVQ